MGAASAAGLPFGAAARYARTIKVTDAMLADSMPRGWLAHYAEQGHQDCSPLVERSRAETAFTWRMTDWDGALDRRQRRWRDDNLSAGIAYGFNIPDHSGGERKIITLCGAGGAQDVHRHDLLTLQFAAFEVMARFRDLTSPPAKPPTPLSDREAECLTWVASGKSDWEIGEILCLSQKTVNHHVERAKLKLHAATRVQAVVLALRERIINI